MLTKFEKNILEKLTNHFFEVVPLELSTFCAVDSKIACAVLNQFGIEASLYVCQMRHYSSKGIYAVGFVGDKLPQGQWDGHVICKTKNWFIDAALFTFKKNFKVEVPLVVGIRADDFEQHQFAHHSLIDGSEIKWFQAPKNFDLTIPEEPQEIIQKYTDELIKIIEIKFQNVTWSCALLAAPPGSSARVSSCSCAPES